MKWGCPVVCRHRVQTQRKQKNSINSTVPSQTAIERTKRAEAGDTVATPDFFGAGRSTNRFIPHAEVSERIAAEVPVRHNII